MDEEENVEETTDEKEITLSGNDLDVNVGDDVEQGEHLS